MDEPKIKVWIDLWPLIERWYRNKYHQRKRLRIIPMRYIHEWLRMCMGTDLDYKNAVKYQPDWQELRHIYSDIYKMFVCEICHADLHNGKWEIDHIIPIAAGGPEFDICNVRLVCRACNTKNRPKRYKKHSDKHVPD